MTKNEPTELSDNPRTPSTLTDGTLKLLHSPERRRRTQPLCSLCRVCGKSINPVGWRPSRFNLSTSFSFFWEASLPPDVSLPSWAAISCNNFLSFWAGDGKKKSNLLLFFECVKHQRPVGRRRAVLYLLAREEWRGGERMAGINRGWDWE